jgi:ribosomal-protein-alanine N-acetyltransferase
MERSLSRPIEDIRAPLSVESPDWKDLAVLDGAAFEGFWRMGAEGLKEAVQATSNSAILTRRTPSEIAGYVIVGAQWGVAYLQRLAVHPAYRGQNIGSDLVRGAINWARRTASQVMVLNVRDENKPAQRVYAKEGFTTTGTKLRILKYQTETKLDS